MRRRALEYGFVEPGAPVYITYNDPETGQTIRLYHSSTTPISQISDDELDTVVEHILAIFPAFGRRMMNGHLRHLGYSIPRERLRAAYERVNGAPAALVSHPITRRVYQVPGPNALWHHDGQHSESSTLYANIHSHRVVMIRYRVVIHAFIDGYSRFVTGIQANDNNRAQTVADLFFAATERHGIPSRVRGDHGTENLEVARFMEESFGVERGSYIWGRYD